MSTHNYATNDLELRAEVPVHLGTLMKDEPIQATEFRIDLPKTSQETPALMRRIGMMFASIGLVPVALALGSVATGNIRDAAGDKNPAPQAIPLSPEQGVKHVEKICRDLFPEEYKALRVFANTTPHPEKQLRMMAAELMVQRGWTQTKDVIEYFKKFYKTQKLPKIPNDKDIPTASAWFPLEQGGYLVEVTIPPTE